MGVVAFSAATGIAGRAVGGAIGIGDKVMVAQKLGANSALFGKGGVAVGFKGFKNGTNLIKGTLNTGDRFRVGWSWKGTKTAGAPVFRAVVGSGKSWVPAWFRHFNL